MMKKEIVKKNNGITLIALVVTIVVLLILAGITINMLFSENGIITKAKQAAEKTEQAEKDEAAGMQDVVNEIDKIILSDKGVVNPYEPDEWDVAWTCTNGTWSDRIEKGTIISDDADIIAKFYKTGNKMTPPELNYGQTYQYPEGDEYILVLEGKGTMGPLSDTFNPELGSCYGWQVDLAKGFAGQSVLAIIAYVKEVIICDGIENIGNSALLAGVSIEKITFGKDVKTIGQCAINTCQSLKSLVIPNTVTELGKSVFFANINMEKVVLSDNITVIPSQCFGQCINLKSIEIPESIKEIDYIAFESCTSLEEINIPSNITTIGERAFYNCTNLSKVKILCNNESLTVNSNAFYNLAENSVIYVLREEIKTELEGKYDSSKTTVQVVTQEEMENL